MQNKTTTHFEKFKKALKDLKKYSWKQFLLILLGAGLVIYFLSFVLFWFVEFTLPDLDKIGSINLDESTTIMDSKGDLLYKVNQDVRRTIVSLEEMSPLIKDAIIAIEDENFYKHSGYSIIATINGTVGNFFRGERIRGGSTITQQLAKNAFLDSSRTIWRKLREYVLASKLERIYTKDEILELYLNYISFGRVYGVEEASLWLFGKKSKDVDLLEASILASLPAGTSVYSPYRYRDRLMGVCKTDEELVQNLSEDEGSNGVNESVFESKCKSMDDGNYTIGRKDLVLDRMYELGFITEEDKYEAWKKGLDYKFQPDKVSIKAPHFVFYIIEQLEQKFGKEMVEKGGLQVMTTLDSELQTFAEDLIYKTVEENKARFDATNASLVSADPNDGKILAMVGSKDYTDDDIDGKVNMITRPRQPGSSFKPFVYAAAFSRGELTPDSVLWDVPTKIGRDAPDNFDGTFLGPMSVRNALAYSRNIPAAKAYFYAGEENYILNFIESLGITELSRYRQIMIDKYGSDFSFGWPLALGTAEMRPLDLALGYSVFANNGVKRSFYSITKITDSKGNILYTHKEEQGDRVLDPRIAYFINQILSDNTARPDAWNGTLSIPGKTVAVKTGTSNKVENGKNLPTNGWVAGYTPELVTVVWSGNSNGRAMNIRASGFGVAGPIWNGFMRKALGTRSKPFDIPSGVEWVKVNELSGLPVGEKKIPVNLIENGLFMKEFIPSKLDDTIDYVDVDSRNLMLATSACEARYIKSYPYFRVPLETERFPEWQISGVDWMSQNKEFFLNLGVLPGRPMDESPLCGGGELLIEGTNPLNPQTKDPYLYFASPDDAGRVKGPYLDVFVDAYNRPENIEVARVFINNRQVLASKILPIKGSVNISDYKLGDILKLSVEVVDKSTNIYKKEIQVEVTNIDTTPPIIRIESFPESVESSSNLSFRWNVFDKESKVEKVSFNIVDKEKIEITDISTNAIVPTSKYNLVPNTKYKIIIEAFDTNGNSSVIQKDFDVR